MKKTISIFLALAILLSFGIVSFADEEKTVIPDNPENCIVPVVYDNEQMNNNMGLITENYGTVEYNALVTGTSVEPVSGYIERNKGVVNANAGHIAINGDTGAAGTVKTNFDTGIVENTPYGTVENNYGTVINPDSSKEISLSYFNGNSELNHTIVPVNDILGNITLEVPSSEDFGLSMFGHTGKWVANQFSGKLSDQGVLEYKWDQILVSPDDLVETPLGMVFSLVWDKTINADILFEDENGVINGRDFLLNQPIENFQNVSCNSDYLEKDVDYTVKAENGMTRVTFTDKFFEKNGQGPIAVAPLFVGAIYYLYAVK